MPDMKKSELLEKRLQEIGESLNNSDKAKALIGLGSVGIELSRMDDYSDLDFFAIMENGFKREFIDNLSWLENIKHVAYKFLNSPDGYKLMFDDGVFCEFAVFEEWELQDIPYAEGRIVWCKENFNRELRKPSRPMPQRSNSSLEFLVGELVTNIYVGLCRYFRGEKLSGQRFIEGYAVDRFVELTEKYQTAQVCFWDSYQKERRFEFRYPEESRILDDIIQGYGRVPHSARKLLDYIDSKYGVDQFMKKTILEMIEINL